MYRNKLFKWRKLIFKNYGRLISKDNLSVYLIYKTSEESKGRDHHFYLRTYDNNRNLLDTLQFAVWDEELDEHFSGELTNDLTVKRIFKGIEGSQFYKISEQGMFVSQ